MHHRHIDTFAGMDSAVHSMDAGAKLVSALAFILLVVLTPDGYFFAFSIYFTLIWAVIFISRIPPLYVLFRSLTLVPFVLFVSVFIPFITPGNRIASYSLGPLEASVTAEGLIRFLSVMCRALAAFFAATILVATTRFAELMRAAGRIGMPSGLVAVLSFMYRYLFILVDDASHMMLARNLRASGAGGLSVVRASGGIIGSLLMRSFEHADRLYTAMMLRGHSGKPLTLTPSKLRAEDIVNAAVFLVLSAAGLIIDRFYLTW